MWDEVLDGGLEEVEDVEEVEDTHEIDHATTLSSHPSPVHTNLVQTTAMPLPYALDVDTAPLVLVPLVVSHDASQLVLALPRARLVVVTTSLPPRLSREKTGRRYNPPGLLLVLRLEHSQ